MPTRFDGITEKLKRSRENLVSLETEVERFFENSEHPVLPKDDPEIFAKAIQYHESRPVPLRFSVLVGEIIHHLRSSLDHVVWHFSREEYRKAHPGTIEFPVFHGRPFDKSSEKKLEGKMKGVADPTVRHMIMALQL